MTGQAGGEALVPVDRLKGRLERNRTALTIRVPTPRESGVFLRAPSVSVLCAKARRDLTPRRELGQDEAIYAEVSVRAHNTPYDEIDVPRG